MELRSPSGEPHSYGTLRDGIKSSEYSKYPERHGFGDRESITRSRSRNGFLLFLVTASVGAVIVFAASNESSKLTHHTKNDHVGDSSTRLEASISNHASKTLAKPPDVQETLGPEGSKATASDLADTSHGLPHVVYVLVDDMGWNDVGYQSSDLQGLSPHIDELASKGIKLTSFYAQHLCTPSRAALLTGKYGLRTGLMHDEVIAPMSPWGLSLDYKLLPQYLQGMGYKTHIVGKWHLGHYMYDFYPTKRGFDTFYGYVTDQEHYYNHTYAFKIVDMWWTDLVKGTPENYTLLTGLEGQLSTILYRDQVRDLITKHDESHPFFLYYATQNVHGPLDDIHDMSLFTDDQIKVLSSIETSERRIFGKLVGALDHAVEDLVQSLKKKNNMWDHTVIIFTSDNGGCDAGGGYNTPLRGGKHFLFEGGIRVPAFVSSPMLEDSVKGTTYNGLIHISDMFATIIRITGHEVPADIDGVDQWDAIRGKADPPRTEIMHNIDYWNFPTPTTSSTLQMMKQPRAAYRSGDMKLILHHWQMGWASPHTAGDTDAVKPVNLGIADCADPPEGNLPIDWLFNITADPEERTNLIKDAAYDHIVKRMRAKIIVEAQNMNMASWMNEDPQAVQTWMITGFISPWMTKNSLPSPDSIDTNPSEDAPDDDTKDGGIGEGDQDQINEISSSAGPDNH